MNLSRGTLFKIAMPVILAVSLIAGPVTGLAAPAAGTAMQLQTYGVLPTIVLNLTQSPINLTISNDQGSTYQSQGFPIAAGWSGVYYPNSSGVTSQIANIMPNSTPPSPSSLMPVVTSIAPLAQPAAIKGNVTPIDNVTWNKNNSYMNLFTLFPAWTLNTNGTNYGFTQWVAMSNLNNQGASAGSGFTSLGGAPDGDAGKITTPYYSGDAYSQSATAPSTSTINMNLITNGQPSATYKININSLGRGTSGYVAPQQSSLLDTLNTILNVIVDVTTLVAFDDPIALAAIATGIPGMISGMSDGPATSNLPYPATNAGVFVSATGSVTSSTTPAVFQLAPVTNAELPYPDSLTYQVQPSNAASTSLPLEQQNTVLITTWRQRPSDTMSGEHGSADTLIVAVVNEAVYASNQVQQYINWANKHTSPASTTAKYVPTKEEAQDSTKILAILKAIAKNHPQDAKRIVELFGVRGAYKQAKHDPNAMNNIHSELKAIFENHSKELPAITPYLAKLAR